MPGAECYAVILKQVRSTGAIDWETEVSEYERRLDDECDNFGDEPLSPKEMSDLLTNRHFHLRVWMFASDQGPDQVGSDSILSTAFRKCFFLLKFRQWCIHHCVHLIVGRQLGGLENYFGNVAKIIHCIRNNMKKCTQLGRICSASPMPMRTLRDYQPDLYEAGGGVCLEQKLT